MENKQLELWNNLNEKNTMKEVQAYIKEVIAIRGFANHSIEQEMLMLTEEMGELAKAVRKDAAQLTVDKSKIKNYDTIESEAADVFIVLVSICNQLNIDLFTAVKEKEKENIERLWDKLEKE